MVATLALAAGAALLYEPLGNPAFTKFALAMTEFESPPFVHSSVSAEAVARDHGFLAPGVSWDELIVGSAYRFPTPNEMENVGPFTDVESLLAAVRSGAGECSTWTEVFMMFCESAGRPCREWANVPPPGSPSSGHAVVDVWLPDLSRWAMLDVFVGIWARGDDGLPLSALEFEEAMVAGNTGFEIVPLGPRVPNMEDVAAYYGDSDSRLVQIVNNDPLALTGHWTRAVERLNKPAGQLAQRALGVGPRYYVPDEARYSGIRPAMLRFRFKVIAGLAAVALGGLVLGSIAGDGLRALAARWRAGPRRRPPSGRDGDGSVDAAGTQPVAASILGSRSWMCR